MLQVISCIVLSGSIVIPLLFSKFLTDLLEEKLSLIAMSLFASVQQPRHKVLTFEHLVIPMRCISWLLIYFFYLLLDLSHLVVVGSFLGVLDAVPFFEDHCFLIQVNNQCDSSYREEDSVDDQEHPKSLECLRTWAIDWIFLYACYLKVFADHCQKCIMKSWKLWVCLVESDEHAATPSKTNDWSDDRIDQNSRKSACNGIHDCLGRAEVFEMSEIRENPERKEEARSCNPIGVDLL